MSENHRPEAQLNMTERRLYADGVFQAIAAQPGYRVDQVPPEMEATIDLSMQPLAAEDYGGNRGKEQYLHAVIKSEDRLFGIVRMRGEELDADTLVVTRFSGNPHWSRTESAEPIEQVTPVGSGEETAFVLSQGEHALTVTPTGGRSLEIVTPQLAEEAVAAEHQPRTFGLKAAWKTVGRRRKGRQPQIPDNPLTNDPNTWLASMTTYATLKDLQEARKEPPPSELYLALEDELSAEALATARARIMESMESDPEVQAVLSLREEQEKLYEAYDVAEMSEKARISFEIEGKRARIWEDHEAGARRTEDYMQRLRQLEYGIVTLDKGDSRLAFLEQGDHPAQVETAPIVRAGEKIIKKADVIEKLKALPFIPIDILDNWRWSYAKREEGISAVASRKDPFLIPMDMVVAAEGFDSWAGRGPDGSDNKDTHSSSIDAIIDYASMETDIPPVDDIVCYVQPDGRRYFVSHNAHRTGAFKARGASHLPASNVRVRLLNRNVLGRGGE